MKTPVPDYLQHVLNACDANQHGALADYIPELANANPNRLALALSTVDGTIYSTGDDEVEFTIQSMSKPFAYALAIRHLGLTAFYKKSVSSHRERRLIKLHSIHKAIPRKTR